MAEHGSPARWLDARWALGLFFILTLPLVLLGHAGHDGLAYDAVTFHLPQINYFLHHPADLLRYPATATTLPLYHALLGAAGHLLGIELVDNTTLSIRLIHFIISATGPVLLIRRLRHMDNPVRAFVLALPLMTCWYVISGAVYFGTDGPALTLVLIALLAWERSGTGAQALLLLLVAGTRHLLLPFVGLLYGVRALANRSFADIAKVALAALPALIMLAIYVRQWGGLTPPGMVAALNPKGLFPYALLGHLGVAGVWGLGFGALRWPQWRALIGERRVQVGLGILYLALIGLWALVPTNPLPEAGRFGSIAWSVARLGLVGEHSLAVLALALTGATALVLTARDLQNSGHVPGEAVALAGFLCALMLTYAAYQRYCEPVILAAFTVAFMKIGARERLSVLRAIPLLALCAAALAITIRHLLS